VRQVEGVADLQARLRLIVDAQDGRIGLDREDVALAVAGDDIALRVPDLGLVRSPVVHLDEAALGPDRQILQSAVGESALTTRMGCSSGITTVRVSWSICGASSPSAPGTSAAVTVPSAPRSSVSVTVHSERAGISVIVSVSSATASSPFGVTKVNFVACEAIAEAGGCRLASVAGGDGVTEARPAGSRRIP
jgi:hypothetical protein